MHKKNIRLMQLLAFIISLTFAYDISIGGDQKIVTDIGPEEIILKTHTATKSVRFLHRKHQGSFECSTCHHAISENGLKSPYEDGMMTRKCVICHNKDKMSNSRLNNFKLIAHGLCKECHKRNKDSAPTKCSGCHIE